MKRWGGQPRRPSQFNAARGLDSRCQLRPARRKAVKAIALTIAARIDSNTPASSAGCTSHFIRHRVRMHRPIVDPRLPVRMSSHASVCFIQCSSSRSENLRARAHRGFRCGSGGATVTMAWEIRLSNSKSRPDRGSRSSSGVTHVAHFAPHALHPMARPLPAKARCDRQRTCPASSLHLFTQARGRAIAGGVANFVEARQVRLALVLRQRSLRRIRFELLTTRLPTARPPLQIDQRIRTQTMAPCTLTHAASPTAIRPRHDASGIGAELGQHFAVIVRGECRHIVVHVGSTGIGSRVTSTPAKILALSEMPGRRSCSTFGSR